MLLTRTEREFLHRYETGRCKSCGSKLVIWRDGSITCPWTWGPLPGQQITEWSDTFKQILLEYYVATNRISSLHDLRKRAGKTSPVED